MGISLTNPADFTPGMAASLSRIPFCIRVTRSGSATNEPGMEIAGAASAGDPQIPDPRSEGFECANHQACGDKQHQRHRHLADDQQISRAMPFPASSDRPSHTPQM